MMKRAYFKYDISDRYGLRHETSDLRLNPLNWLTDWLDKVEQVIYLLMDIVVQGTVHCSGIVGRWDCRWRWRWDEDDVGDGGDSDGVSGTAVGCEDEGEVGSIAQWENLSIHRLF